MTKTYFVKVSWFKSTVSRNHMNGKVDINIEENDWLIVQNVKAELIGKYKDVEDFTIDFMIEVSND